MKSYEKTVRAVFFAAALSALASLSLIALFIFRAGLPAFAKIGLRNFILGTEWSLSRGEYGTFPMIVGSLLVTFGAILLAAPLGVMVAVFLARIARPKTAAFLVPAIQMMAGIPSVVYGAFGIAVVVPWIGRHFPGNGYSVASGAIILAIMILPTIISISRDALLAVPPEYTSGSLALGATRWQTIVGVILPAARSGVMASIVLGMGRAVGETMAVLMVVGNAPLVPGSIFDMTRTLTTNIAALILEAPPGLPTEALFANGILLFVIIILLNSIARYLIHRQVNAA